MSSTSDITPEVLREHDRPGPRYTSYPPVPAWNPKFTVEDYHAALHVASKQESDGLALYVHIPFCWERCWYCGCNVVISKKPEIVDDFLQHIYEELRLVAERLGERRGLVQLHWGGGTPTYLRPEQMIALYTEIARHFEIRDGAEVAIEIDPRCTTREHLRTLRQLGFDRVSMGVQDLDQDVQESIGRNQTFEETQQIFHWCREEGFTGINIDLIYGLPKQTLEGWKRTLQLIADMHPDRIATYSYAHLPERIKHQKKIDAALLPAPMEKYALLAAARSTLTQAGYQAIGMDHFADPGDDLAAALAEGRLHRNFMGYTTIATTDMIGIGPSAIGRVAGVYAQNEKRLVTYYRMLDAGELPISGGHVLTEDDSQRAWVIQRLMCAFEVDFEAFLDEFGVSFESCFEDELGELHEYVDKEFVSIDVDRIVVRDLGRAFVRNLAMVFDASLRSGQAKAVYSRTV